MAKIEHPKIFISYCWSNKEYIDKVVEFAKRLRSDGIDVVLDQFDMKLGHDTNNFMEKCVKDTSITNVLILLTPDYKTKADTRKGGAGIETQIISGEVYSNVENTKFIPILFEKRGESVEACIPTYLKQRRWLDLSENSDFERQYIELVKTLYGRDEYVKNPIGSKPSWVDEESNENIANKQIIINNYKNARKEYGDITAIFNSFDFVLNLFTSLSSSTVSKPFSCDDFEEYYPLFNRVREPFLAFLSEVKSSKQISENLYDFYSSCFKHINENKENYCFNILSRIFLHELFIETIAILIKGKNYDTIRYVLFTPYIDYNSHEQKLVNFEDLIYSLSDSKIYSLSQYLGNKLHNEREKGRYYLSGIGEYWMRIIPANYLNKNDFTNADCLLTNISIGCEIGEWFAITYIYLEDEYNNLISNIALMFQSKTLSKRLYSIFNCNDSDAMKCVINKLIGYKDKNKNMLGYMGVYYSIPLICDYLKIEKFESKN